MALLRLCITILSLLVASNTTETSKIEETGETNPKEQATFNKGSEEALETDRASTGLRGYNVDHNLDGLILLACIVGLILLIVIIRCVCCRVEQCEERTKRTMDTKDKKQCEIEQMQKEVRMQGVKTPGKYKSLV